MGRGTGVSIGPAQRDAKGKPVAGGPWKVRWAEWVDEGGERKRKQRSRSFHWPPGSKQRTAPPAAVEFQANLIRTLEEGGLPDLAPPVRQVVGTFDDGCAAFLRFKSTRLAGSSRVKYGRAIQRWFKSARKVLGLADDAPIPLDLLSRELFESVILDWRPPERPDGTRPPGLSESSVYNMARVVFEAWEFCADEPEKHPGCPPPPRVRSKVLPLAPIYNAPPAPTLAECDACIRRIPSFAYVARGVAILARYTGLRASQCLAIRAEDVDLEALTLVITTGKTRREKAARRTVPIAAAMIEDLRHAGCLDHDGPWLIRRRRDLRAPPGRNHHPAATIRKAWEAATEAGEARRDVWDPPTREIARPEHAFRAAVQGHLAARGVEAAAIDALVGHVGTSTRAKHYSGAAELWPTLRAAVDEHLPAIDWVGPKKVDEPAAAESGGSNVVPFPAG